MTRSARAALVLPVVALLAVSAAGCGSAGGLKSAGATPSAVGPARLWPELPPARNDTQEDLGDATPEVVPGIKIPDGDLHRVNALAVVQAEVRAHPGEETGQDAMPAEIAAKILACEGRAGDKGCPVMTAYYRDLTGSGKDELIVGIDLGDRDQYGIGIRVYTQDDGRLVRIMSTTQPVISAELAGRDLIVRAPAQFAGYEFRDVWSWDARARSMLPTRMEIVRAPGPSGEPRSPRTPEPSPAPTATSTPSVHKETQTQTQTQTVVPAPDAPTATPVSPTPETSAAAAR
ncbi:hypothetical protein [Streptomyces indicus]|uniref:Lipoprotein n=1 Tax=Streptomyces indicus TaxID=417292 RepID=A0A1G8WL08_9ACTN|nr:hypothetical protein [Streptomyces indicus]SDJ78280.1 hypothetical protein SAMN05421806_102504 [Streptomyces indicus]